MERDNTLLTVEILLSSGFEKTARSGGAVSYYGIGHNPLTHTYDLEICHIGKIFYYKNPNKPLVYVHQLQSLYFGINQEALQLS